jgi:mannose-1-phosphate guanylyltransferase/mannose-1-phosphate guanylyltransferase/mannose-6-phosphate isomerase
MAGGSGTRLWPASSSRLPKQFLPADEKMSFFSMAVERALALTKEKGKVIIITGNAHIPHVVADCSKLKASDKKRVLVIGEPVAKNTAPAVACAVVYSQLCGSGRTMLVLTSDHIIKPLEVFKADAALAAAAASEGKLVVFGIPPVRPETGYGYIEVKQGSKDNVLKVEKFHEKPDMQTAKKYAASKRFFWNSGMFAFSADFMANEFRRLTPNVYSCFEKLKSYEPNAVRTECGVQILETWQGLDNAYKKTESISFDYAIAEKCSNTAMVRTNFDWIDIGNWEEYIKICSKNNSLVFSAESGNCYVDSDIPVALAGVDDLIVVIRRGKNGETASALITKKGETQKVRDIVEKIRNSGEKHLL